MIMNYTWYGIMIIIKRIGMTLDISWYDNDNDTDWNRQRPFLRTYLVGYMNDLRHFLLNYFQDNMHEPKTGPNL